MFKKGFTVILVIALTLSMVMTGCGSKDEMTTDATDTKKAASNETETEVTDEGSEKAGDEVKETVRLKVYLGGDEKDGQEEVFAKANEMLLEKIPGVQVDIQLIPFGEWSERWRLLTAAGDQMDVAWIGWMHNYDVLAREGQLLPLEQLIDEVTPEIKNTIPEFVFEKATVDGSVYSVPNYQQMTEMRRGIRLYKDIADASVDTAALEAKFTSDLTFDKDDWAVLEPYFAYAKENDMIQKGASITLSWLAKNGYEPIGEQNSPVVIRIGDESCQVINYYETPQYEDMITVMADWFAKGYIREDVLSVDNPRADDFQPGGTISWVHETHKGQAEKDTARANGYGNDVILEVVPTADYQYLSPFGTPTNLAIPFTAEYPEEAMKFINLLNTDQEFYNLMVHGLEGVNYEMVDDNTIKVIDKDSYGLAGWATGNTLLSFEIEGGIEGWNEYLDDMHRSAEKSFLMGFKVNTEEITTELQQLQTVVKEYQAALEYGALGEEGIAMYDEFKEKLEKAGIQKVMDSYQAQINAFLK